MSDCILTTEYGSQQENIEVTTTGDHAFQVPDHAIERFAKFLYPRLLAAMEQQGMSEEK
jgi:hypothetical protein